MSQQSDMADKVYHRLAQADVCAAELVRELRSTWGPGHSVGEVHRFVEEVAACLLRDDVEVGDLIDGRFVPIRFELWDPHFKLQQELMEMDTFFDDPERYVFRRTPET
jgi:hypothetical protein